MVTVVGFMALAIDLGMLSIAKTQTQLAADLAALTASRTLNGDPTSNYNQSNATTNARNVLSYNQVLGQSVGSSQLTLSFGSYDYNQTSQSFSANYPSTSGQPTTAAAATVNSVTIPGAFGSLLGKQLIPSVSATAQAVHRPRDIALTIDFSTSMRLGTTLGYDITATSRSTNNADTVVPTFGSYSSASAVVQAANSSRISSLGGYTIPPTNSSVATSTYSLLYINSYYQNAAFASTLVRAFDSYTSTDGGSTWSAPGSGATPVLPPSSYATTPGGDVPLKILSSSSYAQTTSDITGGSSLNILWELDGYALYKSGAYDTSWGGYPAVWNDADYSTNGLNFKGTTQGPGYYGESFFMWPPDPRNGAVSTQSTVNSWLVALGMTAGDATTLSGLWSTYQGQGMTTGTQSLNTWLTSKGYNSAYVPGTSSKAKVSNAVLRLFNRAYPNGVSNGAYSADWRVRFFGTNDNTKLFNTSNGQLNLPSSSTYTINYTAILNWISKAPCPFPTQMRSGRIKYYGSIPASITGTWPNYGSTDQRFWANFIDYTLGFWQTSAGNYTDISGMTGYGQDFSWGTNVITSPPAASTLKAMNYTDNPDRPLLRHWFGPLNMTDFLNNLNTCENWTSFPGLYVMSSGDSYEAPAYVAKQGFVAAINTMKVNHPNDWVTIVPYSHPKSSSSESQWGRFNCVRSPLGTNYSYATAALLFPFSTLNSDGSSNGTEVNPYTTDAATGLTPSADFWDTPRVFGNTAFAMGLMLAYNQFAVTPTSDTTLRTYVKSTPIAFPTGMAGGLGRKGAQKVIIFETDGLPNSYIGANLVNAGSYSYYQIRYDMNNPSSSEYPSYSAYNSNDPNVLNQIYSLIQQLASTYGTTRNPFRLYAIGFGPVFSGSLSSSAQSTLQAMQYYAGTQSSASTPLASNQILTGTDTQINSAMSTTYAQILQSGVQIALIK